MPLLSGPNTFHNIQHMKDIHLKKGIHAEARGDGQPPPTLSFKKPILRMFCTPGTPSAIVRSPMESPSRMMLVLFRS